MEWIGPALANVFSPLDLLVLVAGVAGGILVGALPGLTGTMAIALLVPFTYGLRPDASLVMLGIPGAPQAAVLFGALLLQGLRPGPELFKGAGAVICYTFILSLFLANIVMFILGFFGSRFYARALDLPPHLLMPVVLSLSVVGSFASRNSFFDVGIMLLLGILAYGGTKVAMAPAPIALGVILGPIIERGLVESMMLSEATGSLAELFFARPISIALIILTVISTGWPVYQNFQGKRKKRKAMGAESGQESVADKASKIKRTAGL